MAPNVPAYTQYDRIGSIAVVCIVRCRFFFIFPFAKIEKTIFIIYQFGQFEIFIYSPKLKTYFTNLASFSFYLFAEIEKTIFAIYQFRQFEIFIYSPRLKTYFTNLAEFFFLLICRN